MTCPSFGINAGIAAIADCRRHLDAIGLDCSIRWARDCDRRPKHCDEPAQLDQCNPRFGRRDTVALHGMRKPYAVAPLGEMQALAESIPPARAGHIDVANHFHITNLGTLLDVLA